MEKINEKIDKGEEARKIIALAKDFYVQANQLFTQGTNLMDKKVDQPEVEARQLAEQALNYINFVIGRLNGQETKEKNEAEELKVKIEEIINKIDKN